MKVKVNDREKEKKEMVTRILEQQKAIEEMKQKL